MPIGRQTPQGIQRVPVTYYPYLVTEQVDEWPEKKQRQRHWALIEDVDLTVRRVLRGVCHVQAECPGLARLAS